MRPMPAISRTTVTRIERWTWKPFLDTAVCESADGLQVCIDVQYDTAELRGEIAVALQLIQTVSPVRYSRLKLDLERVLVTSVPGAEYVAAIGACVIGASQVQSEPPLSVASSIVHEAMHARLWRRGFQYKREWRPRIERVCVKAQVAFLRRAGGDERIIAHLESQLANPWWTAEHRLTRTVQHLRAVGAPEWIVLVARLGFRMKQCFVRD
jgi:hypothetical protein